PQETDSTQKWRQFRGARQRLAALEAKACDANRGPIIVVRMIIDVDDAETRRDYDEKRNVLYISPIDVKL
ncbi:hypothetical protein, partial [Sandarakinorhabdus sp.]|uniref:hypothetical protein n=1 Tax=Sandarakinorhabdus sp. TaxID=1916663 RepID=UPI00334023A2